jgi:SlyX protein
MSDERLVEIEIRVAYQDDLLQTLNEVVVDQQRQLIRLEELCKLLGQRIKNMAEPDGMNQGVELPPHY